MLSELHIENFALIDSVDVSFHPGLNVLTGETGAGKSILLGAIGLVLGGKASPEHVRAGEDLAIVEAAFDLSGLSRALGALVERDMLDPDESEVVLCRQVSADGRSRCRLNGRTVTAAVLREVGDVLADIHGQHDHQSLLNPERHLGFLDAYAAADVGRLREAYGQQLRHLREVEAQLAQINVSEKERAQRLDTLRYQMQDIDSASLRVGEEEELAEERQRLANAERLRELANAALTGLEDPHEQGGALPALAEARTCLRELGALDPSNEPLALSLDEAYFQLEDLAATLRRYAAALESNPKRLEEVEARLHLLSQLRRKYGDSVAEVLTYRGTIGEEFDRLSHHEEQSAELTAKRVELRRNLASVATGLSKVRGKAAKQFETQIVEHLAELAMERSRFQVSCSHQPDAAGLPLNGHTVRFDATGIDHVEFLIAPNPGQPLLPLAKIASGGEMARVMLAVKSMLTRKHDIATLIFDEVDAGIGGNTAEAVGVKLKGLSQWAQILCVTHLPQIAAKAHAHYLVEKHASDEATRVTVAPLKAEDRVAELARLLGGARTPDTARKHAQALLGG